MKFRIVTPSFKSSDTLRQCIESVRDQVTNGIEVHHHIQDGGSRDGTVEYLKKYAQQVEEIDDYGYSFSFESTHDNGMYDALNRGIERSLGLCSGQRFMGAIEADETRPVLETSNCIFAWLNCDEQYLPTTLEKVAKFMSANLNTDFVYGNTLHLDGEGKLLTYRINPPLRKSYVQADHLYIQSASTFFRLSLFEEGLRFDTSLKAISDCLLIMELLRRGKSSARLNEYLSVFTMTGRNLSVEDVGLKELKAWHDGAPLSMRIFRPLINGCRHLEKLICGGYSEDFPLEYSIYRDDVTVRKSIVTESGSWKFTWGKSKDNNG